MGMERRVCRATKRESNPGMRIRDLSVSVLDTALTDRFRGNKYAYRKDRFEARSVLRYSVKNASTLGWKIRFGCLQVLWFKRLDVVAISKDPAVANSVRGRELWRMKLASKSTWEFADGGWLMAWYSDLAGGVH